jgi:hypothetical protein
MDNVAELKQFSSVMKRRFGGEIRSRLYRSQGEKKIKLKCIVYSIDLFLKKVQDFHNRLGFLKSRVFKKLVSLKNI